MKAILTKAVVLVLGLLFGLWDTTRQRKIMNAFNMIAACGLMIFSIRRGEAGRAALWSGFMVLCFDRLLDGHPS